VDPPQWLATFVNDNVSHQSRKLSLRVTMYNDSMILWPLHTQWRYYCERTKVGAKYRISAN